MAKKKKVEEISFIDQIAKETTLDFKVLSKAIQESYNASVEISNSFGQGQQRLVEMMGAVSDTLPRVTRLGGSINDVQNTIIGIASASRRSIIANTEDVEKLYAATQVIGGSAQELSNAFLDVGVGIEQVGKQLEDSVNYIRSIGGNTKAVMENVTKNMEQMNRYQFEGGVAGLTKMAAKASMLRVDMNATLNFADELFNPDKAVEVASAFQRLGVVSGSLVDPFQLMNQSINDPSGLQDSLANVAKQFTYFDEETKSFKINPQGVLTLREMESQAGIARGTLSKMGLAAAELDQRLSAVNQAGLSIASEEDKQYLANIASMKDGKYMVTLEDDTKKELSELTQPEFDKLIEQQKNGPKTLEEFARSQLKIDEQVLSDVSAIRQSVAQGLTSPKQIRQGVAGLQRVSRNVLGEASNIVNTKDVRGLSEGVLTAISNGFKEIKEGNKPTEVLSKSLNSIADSLDSLQKKFTDNVKVASRNISTNTGTQTVGETIIKNNIDKVNNALNNTTSVVPLNSSSNNTNMETLKSNLPNSVTQTSNSKVDVGGKIEIDIKSPMGVSSEQVKQMMDSAFNGVAFQDYLNRVTSQNNPNREPISKTYSS